LVARGILVEPRPELDADRVVVGKRRPRAEFRSAKLPAKKAACEVFSELQVDGQGPSHSYSLRGMESFWYVLMCLAFGGGYFAKVWAKKALWEMVGMMQSAPAEYTAAISRILAGG
jgi:hypothetical protein